MNEKDPRRIFQGAAIIRRMARLGLVSEQEQKLDYILELSTAKLMDRRLQTKVFKFGLAKSVHHARVLIRQRHIRVGSQVVNSPSFMVHVDSEKHIQFAENSPYGGGRPGRVARRNGKNTRKHLFRSIEWPKWLIFHVSIFWQTFSIGSIL